MDRASRWDRTTEWPLLAASLVFLAANAVRVVDTGLSGQGYAVCEGLQWGTWALFVIDYFARLALAHRRWHGFTHHLFDLAVMGLPMLRPLRLLRPVTVLQVVNRRATLGLRGRVVSYLIGGSLLLWVVASLAVLDAERGNPGANIETIWQAAWWALATMTTVGYGDAYPVRHTGRAVAGALMVSGIALLGTVTATLASWLTDGVRDEQPLVDDVLAEVQALRLELAALRSSLHSGDGSDGRHRQPTD